MGFPTWTLWGMGLSAFGALIAITLAFLVQSPRLLTRFKLSGQRLDLRAKSFTGYGLALLLLAMGFFLAGVPLDREELASLPAATQPADGEEPAGTGSPLDETADAGGEAPAGGQPGGQTGAMSGIPTSSSGQSGAMGGLPTSAGTLEAGEIITGTLEPGTSDEPPATPEAEATPPTPTETAEPPATATRAPTATPTPEPSPTPTPTPILVPTARIGDETSTLPVRRLPGGAVLVVLVRGDTVIPLPGRSYRSGEVWREVMTVNGVTGWIQDRFLDYGEEVEESSN